MEVTVLKVVSIWILIVFLIAFVLMPLVDVLVTQIELAWIRHKMRKELRKTVTSSMDEIQKELYDVIDDVINNTFEVEVENKEET